MSKNIRTWHWRRCLVFATKQLMFLSGKVQRLYYGNPSAEAWLRWQEIVKTGDDDTSLIAERARRNLEADVELFIDVLCDTGMQPVFSADDREQVLAVYGSVYADRFRQSLELITDAEVIKKSSTSGYSFSDDAGAQDGAHIVRVTPGNVCIGNHDVGRI